MTLLMHIFDAQQVSTGLRTTASEAGGESIRTALPSFRSREIGRFERVEAGSDSAILQGFLKPFSEALKTGLLNQGTFSLVTSTVKKVHILCCDENCFLWPKLFYLFRFLGLDTSVSGWRPDNRTRSDQARFVAGSCPKLHGCGGSGAPR